MGAPVTLSAENGWTHTWSDLFQTKDGRRIEYTVREVGATAGYESTVTGDATAGFTITNAYTPEVRSIPVTKTWVGPAAGPVTVRLLADGVDTGKTLTLDEAGNWTGPFEDLPRYRNGQEIAYTVVEDAVSGYTSEVSGDAASGFTVKNTKNEDPPAPPQEKPKKPKTHRKKRAALPQTGDGAPAAIGLLAAAIAAASAGVVMRRKKAADR
ncbi:Cna B-type domain-containing protein [Collinsella vaginalis]|uniref:Cna B-type domain-containing protein n=1 Tax=Collinsella vaginalis TaxID=1870987 RepID=UPI001FEB910E|nr:Cna B-type domain-containing protein [Collinsella vaginalis]